MPETKEITRYNELHCPSCCLQLLKRQKGWGQKGKKQKRKQGDSQSCPGPLPSASQALPCPSPSLNHLSASSLCLSPLGCLDGTKVKNISFLLQVLKIISLRSGLDPPIALLLRPQAMAVPAPQSPLRLTVGPACGFCQLWGWPTHPGAAGEALFQPAAL